jgi:hypothetical protein
LTGDFGDHLPVIPEDFLNEVVKKYGPASHHNAVIKEEPENLIDFNP